MNNIKTIAKEYSASVDLYKDYGVEVQNLLESLLRRGNYKYHLTHRLKNLDSLKEKIKRKKLAGRIYHHLNEIEDIMGIRIVFYTETDRRNFIRDLRKALNGNLKSEETFKASGYHSTHATITFGPERIHLDEYRRFKGLKCEVQMTLILNHAWAELEHDIFYKEKPALHNLNKKNYTVLKEKMEMVMRNYIQKASCGLDSIVRNIKKLETAKKPIMNV